MGQPQWRIKEMLEENEKFIFDIGDSIINNICTKAIIIDCVKTMHEDGMGKYIFHFVCYVVRFENGQKGEILFKEIDSWKKININ